LVNSGMPPKSPALRYLPGQSARRREGLNLP
jgi:hypothetical protein